MGKYPSETKFYKADKMMKMSRLPVRHFLFLLFIVLVCAARIFAYTGSLPDEPPVVGPGSVSDPNTGFNINLPAPFVYPNPPVPGIRTIIYVFAGSNMTKSGDPKNDPTNNQLCQNLSGTGLDPVAVDGCESWPTGGTAVKLYYRYKKYDIDLGTFSTNWLPANSFDEGLSWNGSASLNLIKMFDYNGNLADILPSTAGKDYAPLVPFATLKPEDLTALKPYVWVGVFPDMPSATLIEYRVETKDNNEYQGHNQYNLLPTDPNFKGTLVLDNISIDSKGRPTPSDAQSPGIMKSSNYWNLVVDDPAESVSDPWPEISTPYTRCSYYEGKHVNQIHHPIRTKIAKADPRYATFCPNLAAPKLQFGDFGGGSCGSTGGTCTSDADCKGGYACDTGSGLCNPTCATSSECQFGYVCSGGGCAPNCNTGQPFYNNCPTGTVCKDDGAGNQVCGENTANQEEEECYVWVYPCNLCRPKGPNAIDEGGGGDDLQDIKCVKDTLGDPVTSRAATNEFYHVEDCTKDSDVGPGCVTPSGGNCNPRKLSDDGGVWGGLGACAPAGAATEMKSLCQRLKDSLLGDHGKPARCHERTAHTMSNAAGLDLRKAYVALSNDGSRFVVRFDADAVPDQDMQDPQNCKSDQSFFGSVMDLIPLVLDLMNGKVFYVNIWVVRINNPKSSDKDIGEDGYLLYLPMLYNLLHSGLGSAASILQSLACTLNALAITSAKAHLMPDLAGILSTDPSVGAPINTVTNCQAKVIDSNNNFIIFSLDTTSATSAGQGWQKFIKPNPHGRYQVSVSTMVMPLSLGTGANGGLAIPSDFTKLIGVPQPVDTTNLANFYYRPISQFSLAPDTAAPAVKVANPATSGGYDEKVTYTSIAPDGACTAYDGGACITDRNTYFEVNYFQTTVYDAKTATFTTDYRLPKVKLTFNHAKETHALPAGTCTDTAKDDCHPVTDAALNFFRNTDNTKIISHALSMIPGYKIDFDPDGTLGGIIRGGYNVYRRYSTCSKTGSKTCDPTDNVQWGAWSSWTLLNDDINGNEEWKWTYGTDPNVTYRTIEDDPVYFPVENFCDPTYHTCLSACGITNPGGTPVDPNDPPCNMDRFACSGDIFNTTTNLDLSVPLDPNKCTGNASTVSCVSACNSQCTDCQNQYVNQKGEVRPKRKWKEPQDLLNASVSTCYMWFMSRRADGKTVWKRKQTTCSVTPSGGNVQGIFTDADRYDEVRYLLSTDASLSHNDPVQTIVPSSAAKYYRYQYMVTAADKPNLYCVHRSGVKVYNTGDTASAHNDVDGGNEYLKNVGEIDSLDPTIYDLDVYACPYLTHSTPPGCSLGGGHPVDIGHTLTLKYGTAISINDKAPETLTQNTTSTQVTITHNSPDTEHATLKGAHLVLCDPSTTVRGVEDGFPAYNETPSTLGVISKIIFVKPKPGPALMAGDMEVLRKADVDGDGVISNTDFELIRLAFGSRLGDEKYNINYDLNGDGKITMADIAVVLKSLQGKQLRLVPPK